MKKIFYSMLACVAIFASSCSNDEIEIEAALTEEVATLNLNVSTSNLYSTLGITNSITNSLGNYDEYIAVWSLLYDESGNLVDSINSYANTIRSINQSFDNVKLGTYTLVTIQTIIDADDENLASQSWELVDIDKLSTLCLMDKGDYFVYWYCSVGVATQTIVVDADKTISVSPETIGYLIDIDYENFDNSGYVRFCYAFNNNPNGYFLNPQLTGSDKLYYDSYNGESVVTSIWAKYDSSGISSSGATIFSFLTGSVNYRFGLTDASQVYETYYGLTPYPSSNEYYTFEVGGSYEAYAYYVGGSTVVETYMGEYDENFDEWYEDVVSGSTSPSSSSDAFFEEPYTTWGASVSTVKSYMSGYTLYSEDTSDDGCELVYYGKAPVDEVDYYFSSSTTGLYESDVYFADDVTEEEILGYVEDFVYATSYAGTYYSYYMYYTSDFQTIIMLYDFTEYYGYYALSYCSYDYIMNYEEAPAAQAEKKAENLINKKQIASSVFNVYDFGLMRSEHLPMNRSPKVRIDR